MDEKLTSVTLGATELRDSDKTVRLFTAEKGLVRAICRGVRKQNAKLKFVVQPLCVCRVELSEKYGHYTITGAECLDESFALAADPVKLAAGCFEAQCVEAAANAVDSEKLFLMLLRSFRCLMLSDCYPPLVAAKFAQRTLALSGFVRIPPRPASPPKTPSALLDDWAYKTLEEACTSEFSRETALKAFRLIARSFESVFEVKLGSADVLASLAEK